MELVLRVLWKSFGSEISKDRDIINHLLTRISVSFRIYSMRGLEKERNKGNKEPRETKGMRVRVNRVWKKNREE